MPRLSAGRHPARTLDDNTAATRDRSRNMPIRPCTRVGPPFGGPSAVDGFASIAARYRGCWVRQQFAGRPQAQIRQSMHVTSEASALNWPLTSAGTPIPLVWRNLGPAAGPGSAASFPSRCEEPGACLITVTLDDRYRLYIGEAEDVSRRPRRYGGRANEEPDPCE
jgi:hypothetical protein